MKLHLTHALVLTQFEDSLNSREWALLSAQDYPIHALYCHDSRNLLFHSDNQKSNCSEEISKIIKMLELCNIQLIHDKQIIILRDDENEYCAEDVKKHFNL